MLPPWVSWMRARLGSGAAAAACCASAASRWGPTARAAARRLALMAWLRLSMACPRGAGG